METVGFVGVGKIGLPISENLIKSGYRVLGYRRSSLADFEKLGGVAAKSPAEIGEQCNVVLSCVPTAEAMDEVVSGTPGMVSARKAVIYLGGDADAAKRVEPTIKGFADMCLYFGPFGAASKVKLVNNLLVAINIAATAEAMTLGLKAGVD